VKPTRSFIPAISLAIWIAVWGFGISQPTTSDGIARAWFSLLLGGAGFLVGLFIFIRGFRLLERKERIANTPVSKIAGAAMGPVKFVGAAVGPYTLIAPLSEAECFYYRASVKGGEDMKGEPREGATECLFTPFFVEDESGRVLIDPRGAQIELPADYDVQLAGSEMDDCVERFLSRHGLLEVGARGLRESTIKPGDSLFVMGELCENHGFSSMIDAGGAVPKPGEAFLSCEAASLQRRGMLEAMGMPSDRISEEIGVAIEGFDIHPRVVVGKGNSNEPFILARQAPQGMVDRMARRAQQAIWGGAALALVSVALAMRGLNVW
jgi:hypothetical protein